MKLPEQPKKAGLEFIVREYRHWHIAIGVFGNTLFLIGSVLFFNVFAAWQTFAVWLFVIGSASMLVSALGEMAKSVYEKRDRSD